MSTTKVRSVIPFKNKIGQTKIKNLNSAIKELLADFEIEKLYLQAADHVKKRIDKEKNKELDPLIVGRGPVVALEEFTYLLTSTGSKFECGIINTAGISALVNSMKLLADVGLLKIKEHNK